MSLPLLWRAGLRYHLTHPAQLLLALLGIALGVAVVLAVDLANSSARASFRLTLDQVSGQSTHQIRATDGPLEETLYAHLRRQPGLAPMAPVLVAPVALPDYPGKVVQLLGVDPLAARQLTAASIPDEQLAGDWVGWFQGQAVALFPPELRGVTSLQLQVAGRQLRVRALATLDDPALEGLVVVDLSLAQTLLNRPGQLSYINVRLVGERAAIQEARLRALLPPGVVLETAATRHQALENLSRSFHLNLSAMSLLALLVGMFLIYNTMSFSVVQRRALFGRLRVLGVHRGELFRLLLVEALLLGTLGLLLGCALGLWLSSALTALVTRSVDDLYYTLTVSRFAVPPTAFFKALLLGLGATVVAALLPALEASASAPGAVLSRAHLEARWRAMLPWLAVAALGLGLTGVAVFALSRGLTAAFAGLFLCLLALALLVPGTLLCLERMLAPLLHYVPSWLRMAIRDVTRHLSRTGVAITALSVAFATTVGVALMISSFRGGVSVWLEDLLSADYYLSPSSVDSVESDAAMRDDTLEALRNTPGVEYLARLGRRQLLLPDRQVLVLGVDIPVHARDGYRLLAGDPPRAWSELLAGRGVLISEPLAYHRGLTVGAALPLPTPTGEQTFTILGIFHDYASEHGRVLMDLRQFQRIWRDEPVRSVGVFAQPGADLQRLRKGLETSSSGLQTLSIHASQEILKQSLELFERTFAITGVLRLLAVLIAFVGLLSSLLALSLERTRELAILRAIGMTPWEVARQLLAESGYQGLVAGLLSLPIGLLLAWVLTRIINRRAFGWTLPFDVEPLLLLQTLLLAFVAALLAAIYPCYRLTRVQPATDLRFE